MTSPRVLLLLFLAASSVVRTSAESSPRSSPTPSRARNGERVDLSAEGTGSDYPKQFGTLHHGPVYAQHHGHLNHHWSPYHPHRPAYHQHHHDQSLIDPYVVYLFNRYARFLPQGLGLYGIYGSTGIPHPKPPGVFAFPHRDQ